MELERQARMRNIILLLISVLFFAACGNNHDYSPKPRGYFRITFPKKEYQDYATGCPYTFSYPKYAIIEPDKSRGAKLCWINVQFPQFGATLHLSYQPIT